MRNHEKRRATTPQTHGAHRVRSSKGGSNCLAPLSPVFPKKSAVSSSTRGRFSASEAVNPRFSPEKRGLDALNNYRWQNAATPQEGTRQGPEDAEGAEDDHGPAEKPVLLKPRGDVAGPIPQEEPAPIEDVSGFRVPE